MVQLLGYKQSTTLSKYYWKTKKEGKNPSIKFNITKVVKSYTPESGRCGLCTAEKLAILKADPKITLNSRNEVMAKCRHKAKYLLDSFKT